MDSNSLPNPTPACKAGLHMLCTMPNPAFCACECHKQSRLDTPEIEFEREIIFPVLGRMQLGAVDESPNVMTIVERYFDDKYVFTYEEIEALWSVIKHEYIPYENEGGCRVGSRIMRIVRDKENELAKRTS